MTKFEENIKNNTLEELYNEYIKLESLINELESKIKTLPEKEEL